jgi:PTH1 family peptidyl-tRNA hydrolase
MNETGWAVSRLLGYYKLQPTQMIVVHDELDIDPGQLRVKSRRRRQRSQRPPVNPRLPRHRRLLSGARRRRASARATRPRRLLLSNFPASAREDIEIEIGRAADAVESLTAVGLDRTQNVFNS